MSGQQLDWQPSPPASPHASAGRGVRTTRQSTHAEILKDLAGSQHDNGLLEEAEAHPQVCWERSVETLTARKDDIAGLAVASDERIEAYLLYAQRGVDPPTFAPSSQRELRRDLAGALAEAGGTEILSLRSFIEDGGARLKQLLARLDTGIFRFPKVHPAEISKEGLETLGFRAAAGHLLYAATLRQRSGSP